MKGYLFKYKFHAYIDCNLVITVPADVLYIP